MSLASVRPFFRSRLKNLGFNEHSDAFDDANRPQKKLEKLFRLDSGLISGGPASQQLHNFEYPITLVITLRGKGDKNIELRDRADTIAGEILEDILPVSVRNGTDIKDIVPGTISVSEFSASDDNDVVMQMEFVCEIYCNFG